MIEGSKSFAKQVMTAAGVPTAAARTCRTEQEAAAALDAVRPALRGQGRRPGGRQGRRRHERPARGPGARAGLRHRGDRGVPRRAGGIGLRAGDGTTAVPLLPAQDYKRAHDGTPARTPAAWARTRRCLGACRPGRRDHGHGRATRPGRAGPAAARRYSGLLYTGLCLTSRGPAGGRVQRPVRRPGVAGRARPARHAAGRPAGRARRPETSAAAGSLTWLPGAAAAVVIAAEGYPASPVSGDVIDGIDEAGRVPGAYVLHAGTAYDSSGRLTASGGRVLNVVGTAPDLAAARASAYEAAALIRLRGGWYRRDIAASPAPGTRARSDDRRRARRRVSQRRRQRPALAGPCPLRVSTLEIFFDLVFAFTLTQLTSVLATTAVLAGRRPGAAGLRAAVVDVRGLCLADQLPAAGAPGRAAAAAGRDGRVPDRRARHPARASAATAWCSASATCWWSSSTAVLYYRVTPTSCGSRRSTSPRPCWSRRPACCMASAGTASLAGLRAVARRRWPCSSARR